MTKRVDSRDEDDRYRVDSREQQAVQWKTRRRWGGCWEVHGWRGFHHGFQSLHTQILGILRRFYRPWREERSPESAVPKRSQRSPSLPTAKTQAQKVKSQSICLDMNMRYTPDQRCWTWKIWEKNQRNALLPIPIPIHSCKRGEKEYQPVIQEASGAHRGPASIALQ